MAALAGLGFFASASVAEAHPRHHHKGHGRGHAACAPYVGAYHHGAVYVRPAPVYAYPVYHPVPIGYRRVWQPGYYRWHADRHCNVWVPGVYVHIRI